jgi:hypothetical protein
VSPSATAAAGSDKGVFVSDTVVPVSGAGSEPAGSGEADAAVSGDVDSDWQPTTRRTVVKHAAMKVLRIMSQIPFLLKISPQPCTETN